MGVPQPTPHLGIDDYLAWEAEQPGRHEYLQGEVYAMTGARDAHNTIALNVAVLLRDGLRGGPCRVYIADMKLRLDAAEAVFYPDLMVTCDPRDRTPEADTFKRYPKLLVEVLSESTAAYDRGRKFELYRSIETLEEVLLVEQDRRHVDLFRRETDGRWVLESHGPAGGIRLASVGLVLPLERVYEDVSAAAA
jgi:Uma2 family endonuclease